MPTTQPRTSAPPAGAAIFRTRRFDVRRWGAGDLLALHQVLGDPRVVWWDPEAGSLEHSRTILARIRDATVRAPDGCGWFAVVERDREEIVGNIVLREPTVDSDGLEIGWHVRVADQRRGVATEAARGAIEHTGRHLALPRVVALIAVGNAASERVAAKLGMRASGPFLHLGLPHRLHVLDLPVRGPGG